MVGIIVIKFGGSVLKNDKTIRKSADMIFELYEKGLRPLVVVSALKGATDNLLTLTKTLNNDTSPEIMDQIISMGERTSAKLFSTALASKGLKPTIVDPEFENWPIITDDTHFDANPIYDDTKKEVLRKILPMLENGEVPVVCGFIGKTKKGKITTLGRGGTDTTAILLASCLNAKEIVLVKDVETVFSSDPDVVIGAVPLKNLNSEEAFLLSSGGAKFLHAKALHYNRSGVKIRISSLENGSNTGTIIDGGIIDLMVEPSPNHVTMVTIIGDKVLNASQIRQLMIAINNIEGQVLSLTLDSKSTILYIANGKNLNENIHNIVMENKLGKAVSFFEDLRMILVKGSALETIPGLIQRVTQPLARKNINLYGLITISSSIRLFVSKKQVEKTLPLLRTALLAIK
ncbi:aspartate kinase [Thermoproteota archaeon]